MKKTFQTTALCCLFLNCYLFSHSQAGTLDAQFGDSGKVRTFFVNADYSYVSLLQPDNKIILAGGVGYQEPYQQLHFCMTRYKSNGRLDKTFGDNGHVITNLGYNSYFNALAIQQDGKIVAAGYLSDNIWDVAKSYFAVLRYQTNGLLDSSFGNNGYVLTPVGIGNDNRATSIALLPDGKIVVSGSAKGESITIVRYNTNGKRDSTFGENGIVFSRVNSIAFRMYAMKILENGSIIIGGGSSKDYNNYHFTLAKYQPNGKLDSSFGKNGLAVTIFDSTGISTIKDLSVLPDGKIITIGGREYYYEDSYLARYYANGSLDKSFGNNGKLILEQSGIGKSLVVQSDGKYVACNNNYILYRFMEDGTPDSSFGNGGKTKHIGFRAGYSSISTDIQIGKDNKILVSGYAYDYYEHSFFTMAKFNNDLKSYPSSTLYATAANVTGATVFPNPARDILHIEGLNKKSQNKIAIQDINGKTIAVKTVNNSNYNWNIQNLAAGIYFLVIKDRDIVVSSLKFVKQ